MIYLTELGKGLPTERVLSYEISEEYYYYDDEQLKKIECNNIRPPHTMYLHVGTPDNGFTVVALMDYHKPTNQSEWKATYKQASIAISKTYKTKSEAEQKLKEIIKGINNSLNEIPSIIQKESPERIALKKRLEEVRNEIERELNLEKINKEVNGYESIIRKTR